MASSLVFVLGGTVFEAVPVKLERKKLYGYTDVVATDASGEVCQAARLDPDDSLIVPPGGKLMVHKFLAWKTNKESNIAENVKKGWVEA